MTTSPIAAPSGFAPIAWLDARGKGAWIATMVLSFILFWPLGLVVLFYTLTTGRIGGGGGCATKMRRRYGNTGNHAFDAYKEDTLRRLEDEQAAFEEFLNRLRQAKDKAEFDEFMDERATKADDAEK